MYMPRDILAKKIAEKSILKGVSTPQGENFQKDKAENSRMQFKV